MDQGFRGPLAKQIDVLATPDCSTELSPRAAESKEAECTAMHESFHEMHVSWRLTETRGFAEQQLSFNSSSAKH